MIFCWFTPTEADVLVRCCIDPTLRAKLTKQIAANLIPCDEEPRAVLLEDHGDGLTMTAVTYFTQAAADKAAEAWWAQAMDDQVYAASCQSAAPLAKRSRVTRTG